MKRPLALLVNFTIPSLLAKNTDKKGPSNSAHKRGKNNNQKLKNEETNTNADPNVKKRWFKLKLNGTQPLTPNVENKWLTLRFNGTLRDAYTSANLMLKNEWFTL